MTRALPRQRGDYALFSPHQTRWNDNDQYGHMFNAIYAELFDGALNEWLLARQMLGVAEGEPRVVIAESGIAFFSEVAFPDRLEIGVRLDHLGRSSAVFGLGMFRAGEAEERAQSRFVCVCVDPETHRPMPWDERHRAELTALSPR